MVRKVNVNLMLTCALDKYEDLRDQVKTWLNGKIQSGDLDCYKGSVVFVEVPEEFSS